LATCVAQSRTGIEIDVLAILVVAPVLAASLALEDILAAGTVGF
jgi:hypothetical protein